NKITFVGAVSNVITAINTAIADGKITPTERNNVNTRFNEYKGALASFSTAIENANKAIQDEIKALADNQIYDLNHEIYNDIKQNLASAQADANVAKAKTKFMTEVDGGLIYSAMMKLFDAETGEEMAGISGILGALRNMPAF